MSINLLIKNLKFLFKNKIQEQIVSKTDLEAAIEEKIIEMSNIDCYPNIMGLDETYEKVKNGASLIRFGDGELSLINGNDIPFQKYNSILGKRLAEILSTVNSNICIAVPTFIFKNKDNLNDISKDFWTKNGKKFRDSIQKYISKDNKYYAAEISIANEAYKNIDKDKYFEKMKKIWSGKDITIICGKTVFKKIDYNIFSSAKNIEYIHAPSINAYSEYEKIKTKAIEINKNKLVILILGPTAKLLTYDLALLGYQALDIGHIAKSYDWYKKGKSTINMDDAVEFFNPD